MYPFKKLPKLGQTNVIKYKNKILPLDFFTTPRTPSKEFENDCSRHYLMGSLWAKVFPITISQ
jgi:hypothetical protein